MANLNPYVIAQLQFDKAASRLGLEDWLKNKLKAPERNLSVDFPFNPTGWQNESFEDTVRRAQYSFNENVRARLLNEAQAIGYNQAPWIWLWRQYDFYGVSQQLDWAPRPDGLVHLYRAQAQSTKAQD